MPGTDRLYYTASYATKMHSRVLESSADGLRILLDRTVFYPTSGGQPNDLGTLNGIAIADVIDEGEGVVHVLSAPLRDTLVEGEIFWPRRYDHMQQHTGQHLISAVFEELFDMPTLSFHMGAETSTIELKAKDLAPAQTEAVVRRATELARSNPAIVITFEEAAQAQGLRKASRRDGMLRIVEIPGIDKSACGGTHVALLAEVLPLQIREQDKVRGNVRVSFVCGDRALACGRADFQTLSAVAKTLAIPLDKVQTQVSGLQQRFADSEKQRQRLEEEIANRAGLDLYLATAPSADGCRRVTLHEANIDGPARSRAKAFAAQPGAILLMHSEQGVLVACSPDSGVNAGAILKQALAQFGARGGGSATLAQGGLPDPSIVSELRRALGQ